MELLNATPHEAAYTLGLDPDGRERVVVVIKGTYAIPAAGGVAPLADERAPLCFADTFTGEPGLSAMEYECDFAPHKPACDVLLLGSAHAPGGRPCERVGVGLRVGAMSKQFEVVGDRYWTSGVAGPRPSSPAPFVSLPISYDRAYGGSEVFADDPGRGSSYAPNPVGRGFHRALGAAEIFGTPAPNTEAIGEPIGAPGRAYQPMSLGPIGRNFEPRRSFAGTYDDAWLEQVFPFLPADFDFRYFQAAPPDQQIPYPKGGETVSIVNLSPTPVPAFELPDARLAVEFTTVDDARAETQAALDTIVLEPDLGRMQLVWRVSRPLRRNIHELAQVVVGEMPPGWYRARELGKSYYPGLDALARASRGDPD